MLVLSALVTALVLALAAPAVSSAGEIPESAFDSPVFRAQAAKALDEATATYEGRGSLGRRDQRHASRRANHGLDASEARGLFARRFAPVLGPVWDPLGLRAGDKLLGFESTRLARVEDAHGRGFVAIGNSPLAAPDATGRLAAVDLALERKATAYESRSPAVDVTYGDTAGDPVRLPASNVAVRTVGIDGSQPLALQGGRLIATSVGEDVDQIIEPRPAGARIMWQIRSDLAPEQTRLTVDMPEGAHLRYGEQTDATGTRRDGSIEIVDGDESVAQIAAPRTIDADGIEVPTSYRIEGTDVIVSFPHREHDLRYPLLVDPEVTESWSTAEMGGAAWTAEQYLEGGPTTFSFARDCCGHPGLGLGAFYTGAYVNGARAQWLWRSYANSYIYRAHFGNYWNSPGSSYGYTYSGIAGPGGWESLLNYGHYFDGITIGHASGSPYDNNLAVFGLGIQNGGTGSLPANANVSVGSVTLWLGDRHAPTVAADDLSYDVNRWTNASEASVHLTASDVGLGLRAVGVTRTDKGDPNTGSVQDGYWLTQINDELCQGNRKGPCVNSFDSRTARDQNGDSFPGGRVTYLLSALPEGINTIRASAHQIAGEPYGTASFTGTWPAKVDRTGPELVLLGQLRRRTGGRVGGRVPLQIMAVDGTDEEQRSGVRSIEVLVDGVRKHIVEAACPEGSCELDTNWILDAVQYLSGQRTITVRAEDWAGNASSESWSVTVDSTASLWSSCEDATSPMPFTGYSLGPRFGQLTRTSLERYCEPISSVSTEDLAAGYRRTNYLSVIYGDCVEGELEQGRCVPPLEVQSWPACERSRANYILGDGSELPRTEQTVRGTDAASFDDAYRLEIYTGESTVVIFAHTPALANAAAQAIAPAGPFPVLVPDPIERTAATALPLPGPAAGSLAGTLTC